MARIIVWYLSGLDDEMSSQIAEEGKGWIMSSPRLKGDLALVWID